ncbi:MAG: hypothetical protein ACTSRG_21940 [Candidatus Helarchaeota archaeon]
MVWKSNITTEEANNIIRIMSENFRKGLMQRSVVESQLFPVNTYICIACHQLYDQSFAYNVLKKVVDSGLEPREIGPKCKTICSYLNGLAFQSLAMLYLQGRGQGIYNLGEKPEKEPEEKKQETKFVLDFFRHLNPNYRNDRLLLVDQSKDNNMRVLDKDLIEKLRTDMFEVKKEEIKKFKRIIANITTHNFLDKCECRAGIFEHGPYLLDTGEFLLFKDFQFFYTGKEIYMGKKSTFEWSETDAKSPIPNLSIGYILKDMKKLEFNDWGTLFADPPDFSSNITKLGFWQREIIPPTEQEYPDKLGKIEPVPWKTLEQVGKYSQEALNELYIKMADWDYNKRCLSGVLLYANAVLSLLSSFSGSQDEINWETPERTKSYIPIFKNYMGGVHPFMGRFFRPKKKRKVDPSYFYIIE